MSISLLLTVGSSQVFMISLTHEDWLPDSFLMHGVIARSFFFPIKPTCMILLEMSDTSTKDSF